MQQHREDGLYGASTMIPCGGLYCKPFYAVIELVLIEGELGSVMYWGAHARIYNKTADCLRSTAAVVGLLLSAACRQEGLPPQAIFHPGGSQALHASRIDPGSLLVRGAVYVPVYSSIHWGGLSAVTELSATVSIRNADVQQALALVSVTYHDSLGKVTPRVPGRSDRARSDVDGRVCDRAL
jgi:hypothetical protein